MELAIGDMVQYVMPSEKKDIRPAVVVRIWNGETGPVNLQVFTDGHNDGPEGNVLWKTSIVYAKPVLMQEEGKPDWVAYQPNTWHLLSDEEDLKAVEKPDTEPTSKAPVKKEAKKS
jgi:hypothetical protein